jgi:hypothetical protein
MVIVLPAKSLSVLCVSREGRETADRQRHSRELQPIRHAFLLHFVGGRSCTARKHQSAQPQIAQRGLLHPEAFDG